MAERSLGRPDLKGADGELEKLERDLAWWSVQRLRTKMVLAGAMMLVLSGAVTAGIRAEARMGNDSGLLGLVVGECVEERTEIEWFNLEDTRERARRVSVPGCVVRGIEVSDGGENLAVAVDSDLSGVELQIYRDGKRVDLGGGHYLSSDLGWNLSEDGDWLVAYGVVGIYGYDVLTGERLRYGDVYDSFPRMLADGVVAIRAGDFGKKQSLVVFDKEGERVDYGFDGSLFGPEADVETGSVAVIVSSYRAPDEVHFMDSEGEFDVLAFGGEPGGGSLDGVAISSGAGYVSYVDIVIATGERKVGIVTNEGNGVFEMSLGAEDQSYSMDWLGEALIVEQEYLWADEGVERRLWLVDVSAKGNPRIIETGVVGGDVEVVEVK